ncbi:MAG: pentapeptide repeat-containing protein [Elainellaceae cyanobacterium]
MLNRFIQHSLAGWRRFLKLGVSMGLIWSLILASPTWADNYDKANLVDADFAGQSLTDSSFDKANLRSSNLSHADLTGVRLFAANLEDANLEGANLSYATLDSARLVHANLKNAVLEGAFAFNTNFGGATIDGADFTDVLLRRDMQDKLCAVAAGVNPITQRATRETLLCPR